MHTDSHRTTSWLRHTYGVQTSKLVLTNRRDGSALAATLVFALKAEVDARGPLKRFKAEAQLYEFKEFEIKLTNPFQVPQSMMLDPGFKRLPLNLAKVLLLHLLVIAKHQQVPGLGRNSLCGLLIPVRVLVACQSDTVRLVLLSAALQVDCDFSVRVVHTAAAELDLARLAGGDRKRAGPLRCGMRACPGTQGRLIGERRTRSDCRCNDHDRDDQVTSEMMREISGRQHVSCVQAAVMAAEPTAGRLPL